MARGQVTITDIAKEAGVSAQTVSRVINNRQDVSETTRRRIQHIIERMGYQPNRLAQGLRASQSRTLGVVTLNASHPIPIRAMEAEASNLDYTVAFYSIDPDDKDDFASKFSLIRAQMTDGIVVITPHTYITYEMLLEHTHNTPLVLVNSHVDPAIPSVIFDQVYGIGVTTQHLIDLGHRQICEISGSIDIRIDGALRHKAFVETMQRNGIVDFLSVTGDLTSEGGYAAVDELLRQDAPFTAIVCATDSTAMGAMHRLHEAGLRIPEDVSIVGYDDAEYASYLYPPLTTIRQDFNLLGRTAIAYLNELIVDDFSVLEQRVIRPEFILRESTAPPRLPPRS
ncbi:LacI family DNA-binding transcriptional regulator [Phototrophicus methaneseepsis]|uniref:LacI family DNA-binding transcriptional regulator n=1 Tax=Phototrophicus methaneseepsis TaxID=2710758 RepID=A0A7S8EBS7_9CHLR|nr:LacI family DNA-binding transcriptional regulator [Phototrophicus methaneseepsis]QPC84024.1 LacI family DNA-binding transcriptional regulator [Phototrophicus methaneseepsis]